MASNRFRGGWAGGRLRVSMLRLMRRLPRKAQRLSFVEIGGGRYKRIVLRDSYLAAEMARVHEAFGPTPHLPAVIAHHENEVWAQFVAGDPIAAGESGVREALADFFVALYARAPQRTVTAGSPFPARLRRDLEFLRGAGVLSPALHADLAQRAADLAPAELWVGYEYTDAARKNFIRRADCGALCGVDIEALRDGQMIGVGIARAALTWLPDAMAFLDLLARPGVPDVRPYYRYLELSHLARWTKTKVLTGKTRFVDAGRFAAFLGEAP
jgi:hypothetical protein